MATATETFVRFDGVSVTYNAGTAQQRPGRVLARIPSPFARLAGERDIRRIKAGADFVALREQVLSLIWGEGG